MPNTFTRPWLAVQTRPRHEKTVSAQLSLKGYETFLPTYRATRRWADRVKVVVRPLFEGYLFCRPDLERAAPIVTTPGVVRILNVGSIPAVVDEAEISALRQIVTSWSAVEPWPFLNVGQRVRIATGALAGIEGILEAIRGRRRIVVSITMLRRSVAVELDLDVVNPISMYPVMSSTDATCASQPYGFMP